MANIAFSLCSEFDIELIPARGAITTPIEGGPIRFRERNERTLRRWRLRWRKPSRVAFSEVYRLFARALTVRPMDFVTPDAETVEVFFVKAPTRTFSSGGLGTAEAEIEERR